MKFIGTSAIMSDELRREIERQLLVDLKCYGVMEDHLQFNWSESVIEGRSGYYLNSPFDRYSGIKLLGPTGQTVAEGSMDFILEKEENVFIVFWSDLRIYRQDGPVNMSKLYYGIFNHIYETLPDNLKEKYKSKVKIKSF